MTTLHEVTKETSAGLAYSFCTMVTNLTEYQYMVGQFVSKGFTELDCEYLYVDNSQMNNMDAFTSYNLFLQKAGGRHIVLCHQDILPLVQGRSDLDLLLSELSKHDPYWGLCGNAGALASGDRAIRITAPELHDVSLGAPYPVRVISLDENFIVARKEANLALSRDLSGYHWYGSDLCIIADILGWSSYVIDFHLSHHSAGKTDERFVAGGKALRRKYQAAFRSRWQYVVTLQAVYISASEVATFLQRAWRRADRMLRLGCFRQ